MRVVRALRVGHANLRAGTRLSQVGDFLLSRARARSVRLSILEESCSRVAGLTTRASSLARSLTSRRSALGEYLGTWRDLFICERIRVAS